jgi:radical S-adenosyl methionine domain-containing protein 2
MLFSILFNSPIVTGITGASCIINGAAYFLYYFHQFQQLSIAEIPVSINYYFSRKCNYECGFCFHTEKISSIFSLNEAKRGMKLLKEAGMKKFNFAGGKPFLYPVFMREFLRYGKRKLGIESINIVSNGSKITEKFLRENAAFINILAISCDSFDLETNIKIGKGRSEKNVK